MWRTIDAQLRAARLFPSLLSSSSQSQPLHFSLKPIRTFLTSSPKPRHTLCFAPKTVTLRTIFATTTATDSIYCSASLTVVRCVSSFSPAGSLDWNEPVSCSEVGEGNGDNDNLDEDNKPCIPVRAYFFSTSVDLRSLVEQNRQNFIPPTSRMTNYVVLKFGNLSEINGLGVSLSGSNCCYMVVFQYGSIVLFNVREHEVDGYLKIVQKHASGLLPEMRKDGKILYPEYLQSNIKVFGLVALPSTLFYGGEDVI